MMEFQVHGDIVREVAALQLSSGLLDTFLKLGLLGTVRTEKSSITQKQLKVRNGDFPDLRPYFVVVMDLSYSVPNITP